MTLLIFPTHPLYTLLDLRCPPSPLLTNPPTHPLTHSAAGMSRPPLSACLSLPLCRRGLLLMEWPWRDCRLTLNITLLSHCVASS